MIMKTHFCRVGVIDDCISTFEEFLTKGL